MAWAGHISRGNTVVGFWHVWAQPFVIKVMLTNKRLGKHSWVIIRQNLAFPLLQIVVPGNTRTVHLERLVPDTPYSVNIVALYSDGEGNPSPTQGRTREAEILSPPRFLVAQLAGLLWVSDEWELGGEWEVVRAFFTSVQVRVELGMCFPFIL